ncbi:hypothetical protein sortkaff_25 [Escherichia phage sortkaff]|uniref:Uncharacterized protein n=1 Tax=Escherichia phage sortkaff TaxID=2696445 RepID=A0A6C0R140_9CAUD|nr:hypothetical protein sortkaff_25 [Escherichia phage sortkaff]
MKDLRGHRYVIWAVIAASAAAWAAIGYAVSLAL